MTTRHKLTLIFVILVIMANSGVVWLTTRRVNQVLMDEVQTKVRLDLNSARQALLDYGGSMSAFLEGMRVHPLLASASEGKGAAKEAAALLLPLMRQADLDILNLIGPDGRVTLRVNNAGSSGDNFEEEPLFAVAVKRSGRASGITVLSLEQLSREGQGALERASLRTENGEEIRAGLALAAVVPLGPPEKPLGYLYGARLLNQRNEIVDLIKNNVYQNQTYRGQDVGSTTIFFKDVRIATTVRVEGGARAVGTRLSPAVAYKVLREGEVFANRAFVVNEYYISAYEPLRDPAGRTVGAIYVGMREAPFQRTQELITTAFLALMLATTALMVALVVLVIRFMLRPVDRITDMARRFEAGDMAARTGIGGDGELGRLCQEIDRMADTVVQREAQLREFTQRQITESQKLASIGRLAAGIAHEINNPLTGVLTFACLLREKSGLAEQDQKDLDLIIHETTRCRDIVRGILEFSRESPSDTLPLDLNESMERTLQLLLGQKVFERVQVHKFLDSALPPVLGDKNQMQQVFLNLLLNAGEAMPEGGKLTICSFRKGEQVVFEISDTGHGIKPEDLGQIFEPFFTTKPAGKGTGLGLSISYGIVQSHGGEIQVESEVGKGTMFRISLPVYESRREEHGRAVL